MGDMIFFKQNFHGAIEYAFFARRQIEGSLYVCEWFIMGYRALSRTELLDLKDYQGWKVEI